MEKNIGRNSKATRVRQLIAGYKKRFPNGGDTLAFGGGSSMTVDAATGQLQRFVDNRTAVVLAQAMAKARVQAEREQTPALFAFIDAAEAFVRFTFGNDPVALADFGMALPKARTPLTAEQQAAAAAKRKATREARGTLGPKAKKAVKGNVTAKLVVTPVTVVPAPAPAEVTPAHAAAPLDGGASSQPKG